MSGPARLDRRTLLGALVGVGAGVGAGGLAGCARGDEAAYGRVRVAGGEAGGTFVKVARLLAGELVEQGLSTTARVVQSNGSLENLDLLAAGRVQLAPALADAVVTDRADVVAVARMFQHTLHCVVRADSDIRSLDDLAGRPLSLGPPRSGTSATARRLLELAGLAPGRGGAAAVAGGPWLQQRPGDAAISLAGGTVDAMFWWGGRSAPEIDSVAAVRPLRALDLAAWVAPANETAAEVYQTVRVPASLHGQGQEVRTLGVAAHLLCRPDLDGDLVARLVDLLAGSGRGLVPQPSEGVQYYAPSTLFDTSPVPLHPAAEQRLRERHG